MQQYEHYKESGVDWIGQIPAHWEVKRLKNEFLIISGNGFKIDLQGCELGEIPVCKASDISIAGKILNKSKNYLSKITAIKEGFNIIPAKSIVFAKIGEAMKKNNRSILSFESCLDNNCQALVPKRINHIFAYYVLTIIDMCWYDNGGTIPCVNNQKLMIENIPLPPLAEQTAIAHFLDTKCEQIDRAVAQKEKVVELLNERRQILIQRAVTRGLNPDVELRDSGIDWIGQIPAHWEVKSISSLTQMKSDKNHPDFNVLSVYREFGVILKDSRDDNHNVTSEKTESYKAVYPNDLVINKMKAWQGSMGISKFKGIVSPAYITCSVNQNLVDCDYLHYKLRSQLYIGEYNRLSYGVRIGQWDMHYEDFKRIPIPLPPLAEQTAIADYLDNVNEKIDRAIVLKCEEIDKLKEYKQTLINSAVTGKIKIA